MRLFSSGKRERETKEAGRLGRQSERCGDSWSAVTFYAERQRYAAIAFPYWTRCIYLFWSSLFFLQIKGPFLRVFFFGPLPQHRLHFIAEAPSQASHRMQSECGGS